LAGTVVGQTPRRVAVKCIRVNLKVPHELQMAATEAAVCEQLSSVADCGGLAMHRGTVVCRTTYCIKTGAFVRCDYAPCVHRCNAFVCWQRSIHPHADKPTSDGNSVFVGSTGNRRSS
jgi:hypothetical protein